MNRFHNWSYNKIPRYDACRGFLLVLMATLISINLSAAKKESINVSRIDPPHWWTGMKNSTLQLQVYGENIRNSEFSVSYPGVSVDSVARLNGSANWQFVYLNISQDAKPGIMTLTWKSGKQTVTKKYELRKREVSKGAAGFDSSDLLYLVMPDRFADGDTSNNVISNMKHPAFVDRSNPNVRHGGDLKGMMQHLDYIDSLGVTAVWFNPVLENDMPWGSYHGYATTDYYKIDPRFGSNQDYKEIIDSLHNRGIKTVMDMIFNHSGSEHIWIKDTPASDWLNFPQGYQQTNYRLSTITDPYASKRDRRLSQDGWFVEAMPDLNQKNPHLMKYLIQNSIWWIEEAAIDGIRMDTYPYADVEQMKYWIDEVLNEYPRFNIVGECWFGTTAGEAYWQKNSPLALARGENTNLPTVMDFPLMIESRNLKPFTDDTDPWNGLNKLYDHLALDYLYADPTHLLRFLDNHDTERMMLTPPENLNSWKQAMAFLLTIPGIPQIYYGTELLMSGDRSGGDGMIRLDVPGGFPADTVNNFTRTGRSPLQNEAYDFIATLANFRKNNKAIASAEMIHFMPDNGIYLYRRGSDENPVIVVMNGRDKNVKADMSRYDEVIKKGEKWINIIDGSEIELWPAAENDDTFDFSPRQILVLQRK